MDTYKTIHRVIPMGDDYAFPQVFTIQEDRKDGIPGMVCNQFIYSGMTKRQYFAGQALAGILAGKYASISNEHSPEKAARHALQCADELLKLLAEPEQTNPLQ